MHISYISLAFFAIGAIAAPAAPKPTSDVEDTATGFPFTSIGSSIEDTEEGLGHSFSSALEEMKKSAQHASFTSVSRSSLQKATPTPTNTAANFPDPVVSQASTLSHASHVALQTPEASSSAPTTASTTPSTTAIPTPSKSNSASDSSNATPSSTAATATTSDPVRGFLKGLPILGDLVVGSMGGLGLHR
ncbi:hypothetical protein N7517_010515 [Penicillium concentricum]|uniref:Uncharacterized protein n=1 Tax=Penicillium concentricum TaxID=293559 RepID=A0A9W9R986_9EURO|nr:uncharacterized protein N7517_010515 [Penicillium concentricum]KAJ5355906.1 hypothetical protein N7517_010515 [Penicillium concentricum]